MKRLTLNPACVWLFLCLWCSGCVSLERSYPDKHYFVLEAGRNEKPSDPARNGILEVSDMRISPRYEGQSFVYRISEAGYESDFYNQFLIPPAALVTEEIRKTLDHSGIIQHVIDSSSQLQPNYTLEGTINALYGDFRSGSPASAVLEIEFFLSKSAPSGAEILMDKSYSKSVPVSGRSPDALVKGWDEALTAVLSSLVTDLRSVNIQ